MEIIDMIGNDPANYLLMKAKLLAENDWANGNYDIREPGEITDDDLKSLF